MRGGMLLALSRYPCGYTIKRNIKQLLTILWLTILRFMLSSYTEPESWRMTLSRVDLVILGLLIEKDRHGYDIRQEIRRRDMGQWAGVSTPAIYKGLARLEAKKMLRGRLESGSAHPDRTVYTVGEDGRDYFHGLMREALAKPSKQLFDLLIGVGFCYLLEKQTLLDWLGERRTALLELVAHLREHRGEVMSSPMVPDNFDSIFDYFISLTDTELAWLDRFTARMAAVTNWPEGVLKQCREQ